MVLCQDLVQVKMRFCGTIHNVDWANISVLSQVICNVNERKTVQTNMISFVSHGCRTDFADIQNKKECGGNRQWQNHYLRNWAANTKGKGII